MNELDYPTDFPSIFEPAPEGDYETCRDENGNYHNDNGPAYISETEVGFATHGKDWDKEKYQTYIIECLKEISPETDITNVPFAQIESIVYALKGWGRRKMLVKDYSKIISEIMDKVEYLQQVQKRGGLL